MKFTEHELTKALTGAAKLVLSADRQTRKSGLSADAAWEELNRYQRYRMLDGVGEKVLPVLVALPDIDVPVGTQPTFTDQQVTETIDATLPADLGRMRRAVEVKATMSLMRAALAALPVRQDPDALIVPDHL